ncbi:MAG: GH35 family endo-1,4-beta-xylanase [Arcticibacterium sp.]|jgi:GH35 family endo-1,4-beta-xylanase
MRIIENAEEMEKAMKAHINMMAGRYRGKVISWDAVNEA